MKLFRTVLLSTAAGIAAAVTAPAVPAHAQDPAPAKPAEQAPAKSVAQLIEDLGSDSYRTRLDAERGLRQLGDKAVADLKKAAEQATDEEVQWRARRVLRQIENGGTGRLEQRQPRRDAAQGGDDTQPRVWRHGQPDAMRDQFESLFERFERDFGLDIPRARFFSDGFFQDLQQQMKGAQSQSMSMQVGPNGVRVEVEEKGEDGKAEKKVYEAPDMETFRQKYPDVLRRNGLGMGLMPGGTFFHGFPNGQGGQLPRVFQWNGQDPVIEFGPRGQGGWRTLVPQQVDPDAQQQLDVVEPPPPPPAGKRLGVTIRPEIPQGVREYVGLEDGEGLWVETVQPDSLAHALGLQAGDIVVRIGKQSIGSPQEVQQALGAIGKGENVDVEFVRKGERKTASAAKTEAVESPAADEHREAKEPSKEPSKEPAKAEKLQRRNKGERKQDESIR
jgi:hypothetical protein